MIGTTWLSCNPVSQLWEQSHDPIGRDRAKVFFASFVRHN